MVKTRSGDALPEHFDSEMPVKDEPADSQVEPQEREEETTEGSHIQQPESSEAKGLPYQGWGRMSSRRHYTEADDELHDEMMSDVDSDDLFPVIARRSKRESSRRSLRRHSHRLSSRLRVRHEKQRTAQDMNGEETDEEKPSTNSHEGEGVRRSTRKRKQKYDSFNNSWIDGMNGHRPLRGYPSPFSSKKSGKQDAGDEGDVSMPEDKDDNKEPINVGPREHGMKRARLLAELDTTGGGNNGEDMDMYSRVKRLRRPAQRYMFDEDVSKQPGRIQSNQTETQSSQSSIDSESEVEKPPRQKYGLRQTKPIVDRFQIGIDPPRAARSARVLRSMLRRRTTRRGRSSSTSSSEEERFDRRTKSGHNKTLSRCLPTPLNLGDNGLQSRPGDSKTKPTTANNLADVDPMTLDRSIMFANVGGLEEHIRCLKEMVVFPMMYHEVFDKFHIQPAKGVLFHGLPGTGKTLLARALANECSQGDRKVAFFMRKGADCLTKWVGESERQLRLLFDQAYQMRPSIIFFDEMDGLAPVRSSKQDQIHASIVSTLLALMDGLDSRGEVIVIGATNRIDAIDPALRRPGRFDRELYFPLPARQERQEILRIHVSQWEQPPAEPLLTALAEQAAGYCGSDLRALCSEAVLQGLRRRYPQIYSSSQKLLLDPNQVQVESQDFQRARSTIVPAAHRCAPSAARKLPALVEPLMRHQVARAIQALAQIFPHGLARAADSSPAGGVHQPRLLLCGDTEGYGQVHTGPALLAHMEHVAVHTLDLSALFHSSCRSPEEVCIQVLNEARRNVPSIVFVPCIGRLWHLLSETCRAVFLSKLRDIEPAAPVLLLATADRTHDHLPDEVSALFSTYRSEVLELRLPSASERLHFFTPLLLGETLQPPAPPAVAHELEPLPLAPPPAPPALTDEQLKQCYEQEETTLRELRIFLRDCCSKLARNRLFFMFTKPVDVEEVPDYLHIIKQPMDLETIVTKIDLHRYACAQEFLDDIDLVVRNALEYNPDRTGEDKLIRHRACCLRDTAYALIKAEMDTDYESKCRQISKSRRQRSDSPSRFVPEFIRTMPPAAGDKQARPDTALTPVTLGATSDACALSAPPATGPPSDARRAVASNLLKRATLHKSKRTKWSQGYVKRAKRSPKPAVARKPLAATPSSDIPMSHAPQLKSETDSDEPLCNGVAKAIELVKAAFSKTEPVLNGVVVSQKISSRTCSRKSADVSLERAEVPSASGVTLTPEPAAVHLIPKEPRPVSPADILVDVPTSVVIDTAALQTLLERAVNATNGCVFNTIVDLHSQLRRHVSGFRDIWDRTVLLKLLSEELDRFAAMQ